jgi:hypothetical protein
VLRHNIEGLEICTLYAHLSEVAEGVAVGQSVKQGQVIATMGRTSNTREGISKERAHLHFEFDFIVNEKYSAWHERFMSAQRNDHGNWNGHNLVAIEATPVLLAAAREGTNFSLLKVVQSRKEVCRVFVKDANFPLLKRYPGLVKQSAAAAKEGVAGYEVALDFNGAPVELIARAPSETKNAAKLQLLKVNEAELSQHHCCKLIVTRKGKRELSNAALQELSLLTF